MPSPVADRPGLLIRDPFQYGSATIIIPPALVGCLQLFDGQNGEAELRQWLVRLTGDLQVGDLLQHLVGSLSQAGFLHDDAFESLREARLRAFRESPERVPSHAGTGYPDTEPELRAAMQRWMVGQAIGLPNSDGLLGIAAPHVSPEGGWESYRDAYRLLSPALRERLFIVLGTSHYGEPAKFGLTRKPFRTPFGLTRTEPAWIDYLEQRAPEAVNMEDYCHAVEHSIEFQIIFLQSVFGPDIRVLPILCGSFGRSIIQGGLPENEEPVRRFLDALAERAALEPEAVFWVLGVDMAHMGARYGDPFEARANEDEMSAVATRDRGRIDRLTAGDAEGFWSAIQENRDDLKWCGSAPLYTFLRATPQARGALQRYQQWNIDPRSVVSFAALAFRGQ